MKRGTVQPGEVKAQGGSYTSGFMVMVAKHWNIGCGISVFGDMQNLLEQGPSQPAVALSVLSRRLDWTISRGPVQHQPCCDLVTFFILRTVCVAAGDEWGSQHLCCGSAQRGRQRSQQSWAQDAELARQERISKILGSIPN